MRAILAFVFVAFLAGIVSAEIESCFNAPADNVCKFRGASLDGVSGQCASVNNKVDQSILISNATYTGYPQECNAAVSSDGKACAKALAASRCAAYCRNCGTSNTVMPCASVCRAVQKKCKKAAKIKGCLEPFLKCATTDDNCTKWKIDSSVLVKPTAWKISA